MLLTASDPPAALITNPQGTSPFLLIGDHAGNLVPSAIGSLGLGTDDMTRHIAWDIGVAGLGATLSAQLDAVYISQRYSRLVIDCNRNPDAVDAMPEFSDGTRIPANVALTDAERAARVSAIHTPYHAAITAELRRRDALGADTILVSLHSFTPSMRGDDRPWQIGVLYSQGSIKFARQMLKQLSARADLCVGDNEPYAMDEIDFTIPFHAFATRRRYVEIEVRQDLLSTPEDYINWSGMLVSHLTKARSATKQF